MKIVIEIPEELLEKLDVRRSSVGGVIRRKMNSLASGHCAESWQYKVFSEATVTVRKEKK